MKYFSRLHILSAFILIAAVMASLPSCIEDGITLSPADQPEFSTDTLRMGAVFTDVDNPTFSFRVYNRHDKILNISSIRMHSENSAFRINVDGLSGSSFSNIEIRPNDSIYVFVSTKLPPNGNFNPLEVMDAVDFTTNGVTSQVVVTAEGTDVERLRAVVIDTDTRWEADRPRQVFGSIVVAPGVTLSIAAGTKLYFHDGASMLVHGTLRSDGEPGKPVEFMGDRTGNVITDISFDIMSRQWQGLYFSSSSRNSRMAYTEVRNTWEGVMIDSTGVCSEPVLVLSNCRLRNSAANVLAARHSCVEAYDCEFAEAGMGAVALTGGAYRFIGCTFSNYYLFSAITGPLLRLNHVNDDTDTGSGVPRLKAEIINCILYGSGADITPGDLSGSDVTVRRSLLRSDGSDDDNFIDCIWNSDPLFYTVRADYIFDYRIHPDSPAVGAALPGYESQAGPVDFYGAPRTSGSLGAYEPTEKEE